MINTAGTVGLKSEHLSARIIITGRLYRKEGSDTSVDLRDEASEQVDLC